MSWPWDNPRWPKSSPRSAPTSCGPAGNSIGPGYAKSCSPIPSCDISSRVFCIRASALVESGFAEIVERVLVVDCPESEQRRRLLRRDAETEDQAERMMAAQADRAARLAAADDVIDNSGSLESTQAQVTQLHQRYLELARGIEKAQ